jgi:hypothetical protein
MGVAASVSQSIEEVPVKSAESALVLVLSFALAACVEPPPYPQVLPRADADASAADTETDAVPDSATDAGSDAEVASDLLADSDASAESDAAAVADFDAAADSDAAADAGSDAAVDSAPDLAPDSGPDSAADTTSNPPCATLADCPAPGVCRAAATCEPEIGCVYAPLSCDDSIECTNDFCLPDVGCINDIGGCCKSDADCDDGDPCTTPAICKSLACTGGAPVDCSSFDAPCYQGTCDAVDGTCSAVALVDGTPCDDGSEGTSEDACESAECVGVPNGCNDKNSCTIDSLEAARGKCLHEPLPDLTLCDDADPCTIADTCNGGLCIAVPRAELQVAWQVAIDPVPSDSRMVAASTKTGGAVALALLGFPVNIYHSGGVLPVSGLVKWADGVERGAFWVFRINKFGVISAYERVSASASTELIGATFSPDGDAYLLLEHQGELLIPGAAAVTIPAPGGGAIHTLLYLPQEGGFGWSMTFPAGLTPLAPFYLAGGSSRVGLLVKHTESVKPPLVSGGSGNWLPAAGAGQIALSMLSWGLDGADVASTTIGWLGVGAENSPVTTVAGEDSRVAVLVEPEGLAALGNPPGSGFDPGGGQGLLVGVFAAGGASLSSLEISSPANLYPGFFAYDSEGGLIAELRSDGAVSVAQANAEAEVVPIPAGGGDQTILLGRTASGASLWPTVASRVRPGLGSAGFAGDGTWVASGSGDGLFTPMGGEFAFFPIGLPDPGKATYVAQIDGEGHPVALSMQPLGGTCTYVASAGSGHVLCAGVSKKTGFPAIEDAAEILSRVKVVPAAGCGGGI